MAQDKAGNTAIKMTQGAGFSRKVDNNVVDNYGVPGCKELKENISGCEPVSLGYS